LTKDGEFHMNVVFNTTVRGEGIRCIHIYVH